MSLQTPGFFQTWILVVDADALSGGPDGTAGAPGEEKHQFWGISQRYFETAIPAGLPRIQNESVDVDRIDMSVNSVYGIEHCIIENRVYACKKPSCC